MLSVKLIHACIFIFLVAAFSSVLPLSIIVMCSIYCGRTGEQWIENMESENADLTHLIRSPYIGRWKDAASVWNKLERQGNLEEEMIGG